jgi:nucleoside-diphosphate-sugar epimerase
VTARPTVLVTGAAGFIGSHVLTALARRGAEPVALLRQGTRLREGAEAQVIEVDYHDSAAVESVISDVAPTALVHSAWRIALGSDYLHDVANLEELEASLRLFRSAHRQSCARIVGIGTCVEYEESDGPTAETMPLRPRTVYGASKAALFMAAQAWARTVGGSFAWARLFHPFGPGEAPHRLVPHVVNTLLRGERVATTEGSQRRSFLFVEDVADAIAAITLSGEQGAFSVGSIDARPVREFVEMLADAVGRRDLLDIGALQSRPDEPQVLWSDTTRLVTALGWQPRTTLDVALDETISWWRTQHARSP